MMLEEKKLANSVNAFKLPLKRKVFVEIYKHSKFSNKAAWQRVNCAGCFGKSGFAMYLTGTRKYLETGFIDKKRYGNDLYEVLDTCIKQKVQFLTPSPADKYTASKKRGMAKKGEEIQQPQTLSPDSYILLIDNEPIKLYNSVIECKAYGQAIIDTNKDKEINIKIKGVKFIEVEEV